MRELNRSGTTLFRTLFLALKLNPRIGLKNELVGFSLTSEPAAYVDGGGR